MRSQKRHLPAEKWKFWCNIFLQNSKFTDIFFFLAIKDVNQAWEELSHVSTPLTGWTNRRAHNTSPSQIGLSR